MSTVTVRRLRRDLDRDGAGWRAVWGRGPGATISHHPDFLAYHGAGFNELPLAAGRFSAGNGAGATAAGREHPSTSAH